MRDEGGSDEGVQKSFVLACAVGQIITISAKEFRNLEDGDYDVIADSVVVRIRGRKVIYDSRVSIRRVR